MNKKLFTLAAMYIVSSYIPVQAATFGSAAAFNQQVESVKSSLAQKIFQDKTRTNSNKTILTNRIKAMSVADLEGFMIRLRKTIGANYSDTMYQVIARASAANVVTALNGQ